MLEYVDEKRIPPPVTRPGDERRPRGIIAEREHSYLGAFARFKAEDFHKMRLGYYASIALFDLEVGGVLRALEERGLADSTLVIMTSDHGDMLGDHDLLAKGAFFYDPCVKVPLIMRWPGYIPSGKRIAELVQLHDLAATALAAAGCSREQIEKRMPEAMDLVSVAGGGAGHEYAICCYRNSGINDQGVAWNPPIHATMIRDSRYKLNVYHGEDFGELYDMLEDPQELCNLWDEEGHSRLKLKLAERLLDWEFRQELANDARGGEAVPSVDQRLVNVLKR